MLQPLKVYRRWSPAYFQGLPTLAFAQLSGRLSSYETDYMDGSVENAPLAELARRAQTADAVLINAHSSSGAFDVESNLRHLITTCPGKTVVLGGPHATVYDFEWLKRGAHFVVRNEGEETIAELLSAIDTRGPYDGILGLSWRDGGGVLHRNPQRPLAADLDSLPIPDWSIFNKNKKFYQLPLPIKGFATMLETSRGCSSRCSFCAAAVMWGHTQRFKSPGRILEELRIVSRMGFSKLFFSDDNFGAEPERYKQLYEGILRENMKFNFVAFMRADTVVKSPEMVRLAYRAGFRVALMGIESPSARMLKDCNKGLKFEQSRKAVEILRSAGIFVAGFFIVGYLNETREETDATLRAAAEMSDWPQVASFEPRLGTSDFVRARERDDLPSGDMFYHHRPRPIPSHLYIRKRTHVFYMNYFRHSWRKTISGTPTQKIWFRIIYWSIVKNILFKVLSSFVHFRPIAGGINDVPDTFS